MNNITVCFASDINYIMHTGVCIVSILENANSDTFYEIFIINDNIKDEDRIKLNSLKDKYKNFSLEILKIDINFFDGFYFEYPRITIATYFRLLIPKLLPNHSKVIYLDSDIVVLRDLSGFFGMDINEYYFAVKKSPTGWRCTVGNRTKIKSKKSMNFENLDDDIIKQNYFNAGVILMNLDNVRKDEIMEKAINLIKEKGVDMVLEDQNALNAVSIYKNKFIDDIYNYSAFYNQKKPKEDVVILHYVTGKPWKSLFNNFEYYWSYRQLSPWKLDIDVNLFIKNYVENQEIKNDKWYRFGKLSRKDKIKKIIKRLLKLK